MSTLVFNVLFYLDLYFKAIAENHKSSSSLTSTHKVSKEKINENSIKDINLASENEDDNDNDNNNDDYNDDNETEKRFKDTEGKSKNRGFKSIKKKTDLCHKETEVKEKKGKRHRKRKKTSCLEQTSEANVEQTRQTSEANVELDGS